MKFKDVDLSKMKPELMVPALALLGQNEYKYVEKLSFGSNLGVKAFNKKKTDKNTKAKKQQAKQALIAFLKSPRCYIKHLELGDFFFDDIESMREILQAVNSTKAPISTLHLQFNGNSQKMAKMLEEFLRSNSKKGKKKLESVEFKGLNLKLMDPEVGFSIKNVDIFTSAIEKTQPIFKATGFLLKLSRQIKRFNVLSEKKQKKQPGKTSKEIDAMLAASRSSPTLTLTLGKSAIISEKMKPKDITNNLKSLLGSQTHTKLSFSGNLGNIEGKVTQDVDLGSVLSDKTAQAALIKLIKENKHIKTLELGNMLWTDVEGMKKVLSEINKADNIKALHLQFNGRDPQMSKLLSDFLQKNTSLTKVDFKGVNLGYTRRLEVAFTGNTLMGEFGDVPYRPKRLIHLSSVIRKVNRRPKTKKGATLQVLENLNNIEKLYAKAGIKSLAHLFSYKGTRKKQMQGLQAFAKGFKTGDPKNAEKLYVGLKSVLNVLQSEKRKTKTPSRLEKIVKDQLKLLKPYVKEMIEKEAKVYKKK